MENNFKDINPTTKTVLNKTQMNNFGLIQSNNNQNFPNQNNNQFNI